VQGAETSTGFLGFVLARSHHTPAPSGVFSFEVRPPFSERLSILFRH